MFYKNLPNVYETSLVSRMGQGGWFLIFRLFYSILYLVNWIKVYFSISYNKYYHNMFINIVFWLGSTRPLGLRFFVPAVLLSIYSRFSSYLLRLFFYLISFLLFPCASVWENTPVAFHISYGHTEWYLLFFAKRDDRNCWRFACEEVTIIIGLPVRSNYNNRFTG